MCCDGLGIPLASCHQELATAFVELSEDNVSDGATATAAVESTTGEPTRRCRKQTRRRRHKHGWCTKKKKRGHGWTRKRKKSRRVNHRAVISQRAFDAGFEIYDAGVMGLGLRTISQISTHSEFAYGGKKILLNVDPTTGKYTGFPEDTTYVAECTSRDGKPFIMDASALSVRGFPAYVNHCTYVSLLWACACM